MVVCYTGGGTLGHINPALAVHEQLRDRDGYRAFWIGRDESTERTAVEAAGIPFHAIKSGKLRRYRSMENIKDIGNVLAGFFQALGILRREKPEVMFSKGGFVSVPPVLAAFVLRIPVVSHESDASPGLATRINARFSRYVCVPFEQGFERLNKAKLVVSGNPIRSSLVREAETPFDPERLPFLEARQPLILVLGGSTGSVRVNELVRNNLDELTGLGYVYHQCGLQDVKGIEHANYTETPFISDSLPALLKRATLVICRSGANTIAELALFGCASLQVPLGRQTSRGDQLDNARRLADLEAAAVLWDDSDEQQFLSIVRALLQDVKKRTILSENMRKLAQLDCAHHIAGLLCSLKE